MSNNDKQLCDICQIYIPTPSLLESHVTGKKHLKNALRRQEIEDLARRSVFLAGFRQPINEELVKARLSEFGAIDRLVLKPNSRYLFIEYKDEISAKQLLNFGPSIEIGNDVIRIQKREVDFTPSIDVSSLELEAVLEQLKCGGVGYDLQLDRLLQCFGITSQMRAKREQIASKLESYLQKYFVEPISLVLFGSSCTGLGTKYADADLCFVFKDEINRFDVLTPNSNKSKPEGFRLPYIIMGVKDHEEFLKNPILKEEFDNLWPADQSKLLNQFFNAYRKEHGKISDLQAIAYARRPIVSFIYDKQLKFEVSIRNLLGEIKANFVGNVVQQEPTDERYPRGVFKSYTLSLFVVSFLQQAGYIGPVKMTGTRILNKWNTAYEVSFFKELSADDLPKLYRNFFVFVTNTINEDKVHSVRDARIYTTNDFYEVHCKADKRIEENFKFSLVNIQDPIELSHNVGSNIIKHYVALLRRKAILSLSKLKKNSFDFSELLLITESHEASMRSNERPQHAISIEFDYSPDNERLIKSINFLMEKILRFTVVQTPSAKRARTTMEDSSFKMRYMATFRTWIGRRPLRRQFMRQYPQSREVELEQMVSEELQRAAEFTENLVDFHLTIQPRAKNLDIFVDLFGGTDQDGNDLVHFLDTFLHKYFPEAMLGYKWSAQRNLNEEMNEFMEVD